jgi:hypothetical protein
MMMTYHKYSICGKITIILLSISSLALIITCVPLFVLGLESNSCPQGCVSENSSTDPYGICNGYSCICDLGLSCQGTKNTSELIGAILCVTIGVIMALVIGCAHCCCQSCLFNTMIPPNNTVLSPSYVVTGNPYPNQNIYPVINK